MRSLVVILAATLGVSLPSLAATDAQSSTGSTQESRDNTGMNKKSDMDMKGMNMSGMGQQGMMSMSSSIDINDAMNREGSGTSWLPDSTPMYGKMIMRGKDMLMLHGAIWPRYTTLRSGRDVSIAGQGSGSKFDAPSWFMGMYGHPLGSGERPKAQFGARLMVSADPIIERTHGYPLLYQTGETARGLPLHDRQHPHDLFDELSVTYSHRLGQRNSAYAYIAYPGEPALGPPTFMHRLSAMDMPDAPISHHWQDSTHVTFGVTTLGFSTGKLKLEASAFKGREPDENRYNFESPKLDSYSGRLSWNPTRNLALQVSQGFIKSPEAIDPAVNRHRATASLVYNKPLQGDANWSNALVWGQNNDTGEGKTNAYLLESNYQKGANTLYGRLERVQKSGHELVLAPADEHNIYNVGAYSLGYVRDLKHGSGLDVGLGVQATLYTNPSSLNAYYGSSRHGGFQIFFRIRPSRMQGMGGMAGMNHDQMPSIENNSSSPGNMAANAGIKVTAALNPNAPTTDGQNVLTVTLTDAAGKPVTGARIESSVGMSSMDMGTKHPTFKELGNGRYQGNVSFSMAGPWRVTLKITPANNAKPVIQSFDYEVK